MSTYPGPWIQAPDYELADSRVREEFLPETIPTDVHGEFPKETNPTFYPYLLDDFRYPLGNLHRGTREVLGLGTLGEGDIRVETHYGIEGPPFVNTRTADIFRSWRVSTISAESLGVRLWAPTPFVGITPPPDAIGWEWLDGSPAGDSAKSQVVALNADLEVGRSPVDDFAAGPRTTPFLTAIEASSGVFLSDTKDLNTAETDQLQVWDGPNTTLPNLADSDANPDLITLVGGPFYPEPSGDDNGNLHYSYDLTPFLDDKGRVVLNSFVTFDLDHPGLGADVIVPSNIATNDGSVEYGHSLTWHPVWTLRPPIFRWLYAEPQITSAPPLRHTQRDDNHGPSPRNRPARTRQAGHRNTGYL